MARFRLECEKRARAKRRRKRAQARHLRAKKTLEGNKKNAGQRTP